MNSSLIFSYLLYFSFHLKISSQKKCDFGTCVPPQFDFSEAFTFVNDLKSKSDEMLKETMLSAVKETLGKMDGLPKNIANKIKNDQFLKDNIEKILKEDNQGQKETASVHETGNFRYAPYGGEAHITNWNDLYHYFPHLGTKIRLWKLEFKASAMANSKKFKGCANPANMVDWLVPDIEDVKRANGKRKRN